MLNDRFIQWLRHGQTGSATSSSHETAIILSTDTGLTRLENQDRVAMMRVSPSASSSPFVVIALADGMGGMKEGLECAVRSLAAFFNAIVRLRNRHPQDILRLASLEANAAVFAFAKAAGGATLSAVFISDDGASLSLNIGDSRIYGRRKTPAYPEIIRLTVDDNLEEAVGGTGTELLQFCGMGDGLSPHVAFIPPEIDRLILTSDGVHFICKEVFCDIAATTDRIIETSKQLLTYARWRGSPDNASLAVIEVKDVFSSLKYETSGIQLVDPFGMLELTWIRQELPENSIPASPPPHNVATEKISDDYKKKPKKQKNVSSSKKKRIDKDSGSQLSIKIDPTPINEDPLTESENE